MGFSLLAAERSDSRCVDIDISSVWLMGFLLTALGRIA
jgi:hypothetical protein